MKHEVVRARRRISESDYQNDGLGYMVLQELSDFDSLFLRMSSVIFSQIQSVGKS